MSRTLYSSAACALSLIFCLSGHAQDSPSLGDLARQAKKERGNAPATKVLTNDDISSGSGLGSSGVGNGLGGSLGAGLGQTAKSANSGTPGTAVSPTQGLEKMEALMKQLDSLDRASLVKSALQGSDYNFPGRAKWEERLYAAKVAYSEQGHDILRRAKDIVASAESIQGSHDPNDPRVKELGNRLQELVRDGVRADAAFQAVILEGRDLAGGSAAH
jgi:hypothetical protein